MWLKPYQTEIYLNRQLKQTANNRAFTEVDEVFIAAH